mgnify:CR=1 FL=1
MCKMMFCICKVIIYCHKNDLSHCDIKPENFGISDKRIRLTVSRDKVFITSMCKIIDFGSAFTKISIVKLLEYYQSSKKNQFVKNYLNQTLEIVGTKGYMSKNAVKLLYDFKKFIFTVTVPFDSDKIEVLAEYALNILKINDFYATMITFLTILTKVRHLSDIYTDLEDFKKHIIENSVFGRSFINKFISKSKFISKFLDYIHTILMKIVNCDDLSLSSINLNNLESVLNEKTSRMTQIITELNNSLKEFTRFFFNVIIDIETRLMK